MMLAESNCRKRKCKHYLGVQSDGPGERNERVICEAFPKRIPSFIAYGPNKHLRPVHGDHGIQYERAEEE